MNVQNSGRAVPGPEGAGKLKRTQTIEDLSASQVEAIRKIPPHDQAVPKAVEFTKPVSDFLDEELFEKEQSRVFKRLAVPVTLSALLPEPGSAMAHDHYGIPLLFMRDQEGTVRAFLNACQHKGARLLETGDPVKANKVTCPYHAWTFGLDGRLVAVPREESFKNLCKSDRGLAELPCREAGGIVWVGLDRKAEADFSSIDEQLAEDMESFDLPRMHVYGRKQFDLKANWKLVLEPFLEGYHVQRLHAASVGPLFADVPNVTTLLGRNIRQSSGKAHYTPDCLEIPGENIHKSITHAYQVFPNMVIVTSPYYISVMFLIPRGVDRTVVDYMMLTRGPADNEKGEEVYKRSYEMILNVFGGEDFWAAEISHAGLSSGALETTVYCGLEEIIPLYYGLLETELNAG